MCKREGNLFSCQQINTSRSACAVQLDNLHTEPFWHTLATISKCFHNNNNNNNNCVALLREPTMPNERPPLVGEAIAKYKDEGCHVVGVTDPYGRILDFLYRGRSFSSKYLFSCTHEAE
jgi:hypothetical protein